MLIPQSLAEEWHSEPARLAELPRLAADCAELWRLELEEPIDTPHSLVVPAGGVVLKLNAPSHREADHEPEALVRWAGAGAVRLLERDDVRPALLIERCFPGTTLCQAATDDTAVVAHVLPQLWVEPQEPHPFRRLADEAEMWEDEVVRMYEVRERPFERSLLDFAVDVFRSADPGAGFLVNQDFHCENVLRAERQPWLMIDPKPLIGERELDGVGLLRNPVFRGEFTAAATGRWLDVLAELGLNRDRLHARGRCARARLGLG